MDTLHKLEKQLLGWAKGVPHLPTGFREGLAKNIWWIVAIFAVLSTLDILFRVLVLLGVSAFVGTYYMVSVVTGYATVVFAIMLAFTVLEAVLMYLAISPLKALAKKGWVLLFGVWLVSAVATVVGALLTLNPVTFVVNVLFGAVWLAVAGYFLFEIHSQFAHLEKSQGIKDEK